MENIREILKTIPQERGAKIYIVGGFLRDILLGRPNHDVDFLIEGEISSVLTEFVNRHQGTLITLDKERNIYRVVVKCQNEIFQFDFQGILPGELHSDLKRRDFTINALAIPLGDYLFNGDWHRYIIDLMDGQQDLTQKILRMCTAEAFEHDPLRVLRAFRFAHELEFCLEPLTLEAINNLHRPISDCAGERLWDELQAVLGKRCAHIVRQMDTVGIWDRLFPEVIPLKGMEQGGQHNVDVWEHSLKALEHFENILDGESVAKNKSVYDYLYGKVTKQRPRLPIIKLACLLHDVGKQFCRQKAEDRYTFYNHQNYGVELVKQLSNQLKLASSEQLLLISLVENHMDPLMLYLSGVTKKGENKLFRKIQSDVPAVLLISLADVTASRLTAGKIEEAKQYLDFINNMLEKYIIYQEEQARPRLFSGEDVCAILNINPGPAVGKLLEALKAAQEDGLVTTKVEARQFLLDFRVIVEQSDN